MKQTVDQFQPGDIVKRNRRLWVVISRGMYSEMSALQLPRPDDPGFLSETWPAHYKAELVLSSAALEAMASGLGRMRKALQKGGA